MPVISPVRYTKILCTLGPASKNREQILALALGGMNAARINASHGTQEQHRGTIALLKDINAELAARHPPLPRVAILLDTKGAEVRTGDVAKPLTISQGEEVVFSPEPRPEEKRQVIIVHHDVFAKDAKNAECILLDNGELVFDLVSELPAGGILARSRQAGTVGSRRHVNLPGATLSMPSFTKKDWDDMAFGCSEGVDFLALSFIRSKADIEEVSAFVKEHKSSVQLIAKIETRQAIENIPGIIEAADGVMIARGDLGAEVPFERVPVIQDEIVRLCKQAGKPVIVATHMLESMIHQPMPTRAEVTDIAHAATTGTDVTMLSGETASGLYPLESLNAMDRVLRATEEHICTVPAQEDLPAAGEREARAKAAVQLAQTTKVAALVVMTRTGKTARDVAKFRPYIPIIAFTDSEQAQRVLQLSFGVFPLTIAFDDRDPERTVHTAMEAAVQSGILKNGERIVLVSDTKAHELTVNAIQMRSI